MMLPDPTSAVRTSTVFIGIVLLLTSHAVTAAITTSASTTRRPSERMLHGTLQALVGHLPNGSLQQQQLYLQTADGPVYALDLPRHLAESFDAAAAAGSEVQIRFLVEEGLSTESVGSNLTSSSTTAAALSASTPTTGPLQLVQAPTLSQPDNLINPAASGHHRALHQASGTGTAPKGPASMIVFIMDLSACGTAVPATTPQVRTAGGGGGEGVTAICNSRWGSNVSPFQSFLRSMELHTSRHA